MAEDVATSAFAGEPQPVEIYHRGIWYSGELLGWRHDNGGRCMARVRCVVGKLRHKAWKDLADLRLPESSAAPGPSFRPQDHRVGGVLRPDHRRPEIDDETRPHVLLADLRVRPRPPAHTVTPPAPRPRQETDWTSRPAHDRLLPV